MDIWSPGGLQHPATRTGNKKVLALVDAASKYVVLRAIPDEKKETIASILANEIFPQYGPPIRIISDRGAAFASKLQLETFETFGIIRKLVTPHHPQANGQVERFFRVLRAMLAAVISQKGDDVHAYWDEYLQHLAFAYNTSHNHVLDNTPYFLFFGRDPEATSNNPISLPYRNLPEDQQEWLEGVRSARDHARQVVEENREKNTQNYNRRANPQEYQLGEVVYVAFEPVRGGQNPKLRPRYVGPYRIVTLGDYQVTIRTINHPAGLFEAQVHRDRLRKSHREFPDQNPNGNPPNANGPQA
jgi:hypothetical protein